MHESRIKVAFVVDVPENVSTIEKVNRAEVHRKYYLFRFFKVIGPLFINVHAY